MLKNLLRTIIAFVFIATVSAEANDHLFTFTFYEFEPNASYDPLTPQKEYLSDSDVLKTYQEHGKITMLEKHSLRLTKTKYSEYSPSSTSQQIDLDDVMRWCTGHSFAGAHIIAKVTQTGINGFFYYGKRYATKNIGTIDGKSISNDIIEQACIANTVVPYAISKPSVLEMRIGNTKRKILIIITAKQEHI